MALKQFLLTATALGLFSCEKKMSPAEIFGIGTTPCAAPAGYTTKLGFVPLSSAYSTSERNISGIVLKDLPENESDTIGKKVYQHPTWVKFGPMGAITVTDNGTVFTAPIPVINTLGRPLSQMNRIYKIDHLTGEMSEFFVLPDADTSAGTVPFAVLGLYYDCHGRKLYASTVAGSTRDRENGVIYAIDVEKGKISDRMEGYDAASLFVCGVTGEKRLYFGSARTSEINSIPLSKSGEFDGDVATAFTLDRLGPRGDDKARRIRMDKRRFLIVTGVEFNFNLAAPTIIPITNYAFVYNGKREKWELAE